ncbi:pentatricopeptide repeat-containing protein At2g36730-like [Prosopis cineraria]|uniref:pentatricopeptide repeat-containing protein At2g36730-like n=1 Tax=Prosopis cineraria TaxID=364024 RepID=UPI00240EA1AE|nr:pentatricopeptide repeat-containing protein At2g36730-like [Prosopis cineraria]XP_054803044.1 pentatricopeptide repeat-containing protein At2g36730-like [Prosopis cineraria]
MVRLAIPPKLPNLNANFVSKKHQCLSLLNLCVSTKQLSQIQAQLQVSGLSQDPFLLRKLVYFYALSSFQNLNYARTLVHISPNPPSVAWNILIRGYASSHSPIESIWVFHEMRSRGITRSKLTFPFLFKSCAMVAALGEGRQVQAEVVKCGLDSDVYVQNTLINFYACCKKILDAEQVFNEMSERTVVSWNSVIDACVQNLWFKDGIGYFVKMRDCGFEPDETTMVVMLSACAELGNLSLGRWVHSQVIVRGMVLNCQLGTALVDTYAKSGAVGYAKFVFSRMEEKNVWTWSAMILGLALHGFAEEALTLFPKINDHPTITPNYVTYLGVLCACSHAGMVNEGYQYFQDMEKVHGVKPMMIHYGAMVDILCRAGYLIEAYDFIQGMPIVPDAIVWRTLLSACTIHDVNDHTGIGNKVRKRLLQLEPRRGGNFVIVANMYAEVGMWENAANARKAMKDKGLKKMAGESCVELGGSMYSFFSGYDSRPELIFVYLLLDGLNLHLKMVNYL